ncbi:hypothetical protein [Streptomyces sp. NRRL S-337]|uniref:hypothetical protein n=1 Tax=Streptomyces sp. NRRL S-337 TaxID=1463900 RepID=UPI001F3F92F9|nr:hypothetical protein [Streptomyces sp. NRRL S-337]
MPSSDRYYGRCPQDPRLTRPELALAVVLVLFALTAPMKVTATIGLFAAGVAGFSLGPIMQTYVMTPHRSGSAPCSPWPDSSWPSSSPRPPTAVRPP